MKLQKIFLTIIFIVMNCYQTYAQSNINRFFYELSYIPSSKEGLKKEMMVLDISEKGSIFQDYLNVSQDSIIIIAMDRMRKYGDMDITKYGVKLGEFKYQIRKDYPISKVSFKEKLLNDVFEYDENIDFKWNIENKFDTISSYKVQLATCFYGGRFWNAWFSNDLPFSDGPYKFYGLPGLILKITDSENIYSFSFVGNKKIKENPNSISEIFMSGYVNKVSKEKFNDIYKNFQEDPIGSLRPMLNNPDVMSRKMSDGSSFLDFIRQQEKMLKENLNKIKNPIEL